MSINIPALMLSGYVVKHNNGTKYIPVATAEFTECGTVHQILIYKDPTIYGNTLYGRCMHDMELWDGFESLNEFWDAEVVGACVIAEVLDDLPIKVKLSPMLSWEDMMLLAKPKANGALVLESVI